MFRTKFISIRALEYLSVGLLYLSCHNLLKKRYGLGKPITRKQLYCELGRHFLIPWKLRDCMLKELEETELIKRENSDIFTLVDIKLDLEEDANKLFKKMHMF